MQSVSLLRSTLKPFIDYSQWSLFTKCEWAWLERYVNQLGRKPKEGEQDSVFTLGTLVHAGLEYYRRDGRPEVPPEIVTKTNASYDCYDQAQQLLAGYVLRYPKENFAISKTEAPVRFKLREDCDGLAKIDNYFHCDKPTWMETGLGFGESGLPPEFKLDSGWYLREYKTKDASKHRGNYIQGWRMNMQVNFQMLALRELVGEMPKGLLVDVIEKPKPYVPKHTCKQCKTQSARSDWTPTGEGYSCPSCTNVQELDTSNKSRVERIASYYRLLVTRTPQVLEKTLREIDTVAQRMQALRQGADPARATERCVDSIFGPCEYFKAHGEDVGASYLPNEYVQIDSLGYVNENT